MKNPINVYSNIATTLDKMHPYSNFYEYDKLLVGIINNQLYNTNELKSILKFNIPPENLLNLGSVYLYIFVDKIELQKKNYFNLFLSKITANYDLEVVSWDQLPNSDLTESISLTIPKNSMGNYIKINITNFFEDFNPINNSIIILLETIYNTATEIIQFASYQSTNPPYLCIEEMDDTSRNLETNVELENEVSALSIQVSSLKKDLFTIKNSNNTLNNELKYIKEINEALKLRFEEIQKDFSSKFNNLDETIKLIHPLKDDINSHSDSIDKLFLVTTQLSNSTNPQILSLQNNIAEIHDYLEKHNENNTENINSFRNEISKINNTLDTLDYKSSIDILTQSINNLKEDLTDFKNKNDSINNDFSTKITSLSKDVKSIPSLEENLMSYIEKINNLNSELININNSTNTLNLRVEKIHNNFLSRFNALNDCIKSVELLEDTIVCHSDSIENLITHMNELSNSTNSKISSLQNDISNIRDNLKKHTDNSNINLNSFRSELSRINDTLDTIDYTTPISIIAEDLGNLKNKINDNSDIKIKLDDISSIINNKILIDIYNLEQSYSEIQTILNDIKIEKIDFDN